MANDSLGRETREKDIEILRPKIHLGGPIGCTWNLPAVQRVTKRGPCRNQYGESGREEMMRTKRGEASWQYLRVSVFKRQTDLSPNAMSPLWTENPSILFEADFLIYKMANISIDFARLWEDKINTKKRQNHVLEIMAHPRA